MPLDANEKALIMKRRAAAGWDAPSGVPDGRYRVGPGGKLRRVNLGVADQAQDLLANMRVNWQARGVLGIIADKIHQGYAVAETFPWSASSHLWQSLPDVVRGVQTPKEAAIDLLNQANTYAQKIYATIPNDSAPVSAQTRRTVTIAVKNATKAVKLVSSAANDLNASMLREILEYLAQKTKEAADYLANKAKDKFGFDIPKPIIYATLALLGVTTLFIAAKLVHTVVLGRARLAEAEEEAIQIADSSRRKKASRKVATIS